MSPSVVGSNCCEQDNPTEDEVRDAILAMLVEVRDGIDQTLAGTATLWSAIADLALTAAATAHLYLAARHHEETT
jgi:hypothetical protein